MDRSWRRKYSNLKNITKNTEYVHLLLWQQQGQQGMAERQGLGHSRDPGSARPWNERSSWALCVLTYPVLAILPPGDSFFGDCRAGHRPGGVMAGLSQKEKPESAQYGIVLLHSY